MAAPPITERSLPHFNRRAAVKESVRFATTANVTLASGFENGDTIDGVTLATGDRFLAKDQSTGSQNGLYTVNASGAPTRAYDQSTDDPSFGFLVFVREGTANGGKVFKNTNTTTPTIGSTSLTFAELGGGASYGIPANTYGTPAAGAAATAVRTDAVLPPPNKVVLTLTNKVGSSVSAGDVVKINTGTDESFNSTTTGQLEGTVGIVQETIADNAAGRVLVAGYAALVNVPASVTRGHYIETHTVAKQAVGNSTRRAGSFGQFLTGGTTPTAILWGQTDQTASGGGGSALTIKDEGSSLATDATSIDFVGAGVVASGSGAAKTVTIDGVLPRGFIGCRAYNAAAQTISAATETTATFDSEEYDSDGIHEGVTNPGRVTIPAGMGGKWRISGHVIFIGASGAAYGHLRKNGTTVIVGSEFSGSGTDLDYFYDVTQDLAAGDYVELRVYRSSGTSVGAATATQRSTIEAMKLDSGKVGQGIGASVYKSADQLNLTTSTTQKVTFDSTEKDTDGFFDNANDRLTIPAGLSGMYLVTGMLSLTGYGAASGDASGLIRLNGNSAVDRYFFRDALDNTTGQQTDVSFALMMPLVAGDYLEMFANPGSRSDVDVRSDIRFTKLQLTRLDSGASDGPYTGPIARAALTSDVNTTSATYQDSGLSIAFAPSRATALLEIEIFGEYNAVQVSGSPSNVLIWHQIYNSTDAVSVHEQVVGLLRSTPAFGNNEAAYGALALRGYYQCNSTATRTFKLRHKSNVATDVQSELRGARGAGIVMVIREVR